MTVPESAAPAEIEIQREESGLTWLTLNRPAKLNALTPNMVRELHRFLDSLVDDRNTRVVVLRGAGRGFCAGMDLNLDPWAIAVLSGGTPEERAISHGMRVQRTNSSLVRKIHRAPQPFIALIQGPVAGAGFSLALACEVRIAGESLAASAAFIKVGLTGGDMGSSFFLPRICGMSAAAELLLTGDPIDAARAREIGLVSRVVPDDQLEQAGRELAGRMLANTPMSLWLTKECLWANLAAGTLESALAIEDRQQILSTVHPDAAEALHATREKRKPTFIG